MFFTKQETKQAEYFVNCVMFEISIDLSEVPGTSSIPVLHGLVLHSLVVLILYVVLLYCHSVDCDKPGKYCITAEGSKPVVLALCRGWKV